jgi:DNA-binding Lrp family transcriptional regulator
MARSGLSIPEIAAKVGMATPTVNKRIKRLQEWGSTGPANHYHRRKVSASTRWETFSNDLAFCAYPARRAMTAQEHTMAK